MDEIKTAPKTVDEILNLSREKLTELVDRQYSVDFKGAKTDDEVMQIRMSI
jgi:hypothetical protein